MSAEKSEFSFDIKNEELPIDVIKKNISFFNEKTNGYVVAEAKDYGGPVTDYTVHKRSLSDISFAFVPSPDKSIDIQDDLGEQSEEDNRYEVYLRVKNIENYKYRLMFMQHGAISYPVYVVLSDLSLKAYGEGFNHSFWLKTVDDLNKMMEAILSSSQVHDLVQSLIDESMRREHHKE